MKLSKLILLILFISVLNAGDKIKLNFQDLKIENFIKMVAKITHKNILLNTNISGKVNFIAVKPIKKEELFNILTNVLKSKGWTLVETNDGFLKLIKIRDAIKEIGSNRQLFGQISTEVITLKNVKVNRVYRELRPFLSQYGTINILSDRNMLIVSDYPNNLKTIKKLISKIDKTEKQITKFIKIKNNSAKNVYLKVNEIFSSLFDKHLVKYQVLTDDITNSIILIAPKSIINQMIPYITKFDVKPSIISQSTEIVKINNSDSDNLVKIITDVINKKYTKEKPSVTSDKETNSIIIVGDEKQREVIKTIIKALDIPKEQVYVKVKILEISNVKSQKVGLEWGLFGGVSNSSGLYTMSANLGGPAIAFDVGKLGLSIPAVTKGLALGATLDLLETSGAAKKLSEPSILCINNTSSSIYVGKTESVVVQSTVGATTTDLTKNTYSRQDIGLTLQIKPRIDRNKKVSLSVSYLIEDILPGSKAGLPTTSKRKLSTSTIVQNGQSIIIGGLARDNKAITLHKVPILGDIPFIGALFRHTQTDIDKTTIVMILTPYIVKDASQFSQLKETLAKLNILEQQFVKKLKEKKKKKEKKNENTI